MTSTLPRFTIHAQLDYVLAGQIVASQTIGQIAASTPARAREVFEYCTEGRAQEQYEPLRVRALRMGYQPNVRVEIIDHKEGSRRSWQGHCERFGSAAF